MAYNPNNQPSVIGSVQPGAKLPASSGRFTNLSKYLQANQPAQFGQQVASKVAGQAEQAKQGTEEAAKSFQTAAQKGSSFGQAGFGTQQEAKQAASEAITGAGVSPASISSGNFQTLLQGQYAGPQSLENQEKLQEQAATAARTGQQLVTGEGRQAYLAQRYGAKPSYTGGQQRLDALLLAQAAPELQRARQASVGLQGRVENTAARATDIARQRAGESKELAGTVGKELTGAAEALSGDINRQVAEQQSEERKAVMRTTSTDDFKSKYGAQWAAQPGESVGDWWNRTGGGPLAGQGMGGGINRSTAINAAQVARLQALQGLSGGIGNVSALSGIDPSKMRSMEDIGQEMKGRVYGQAAYAQKQIRDQKEAVDRANAEIVSKMRQSEARQQYSLNDLRQAQIAKGARDPNPINLIRALENTYSPRVMNDSIFSAQALEQLHQAGTDPNPINFASAAVNLLSPYKFNEGDAAAPLVTSGSKGSSPTPINTPEEAQRQQQVLASQNAQMSESDKRVIDDSRRQRASEEAARRDTLAGQEAQAAYDARQEEENRRKVEAYRNAQG